MIIHKPLIENFKVHYLSALHKWRIFNIKENYVSVKPSLMKCNKELRVMLWLVSIPLEYSTTSNFVSTFTFFCLLVSSIWVLEWFNLLEVIFSLLVVAISLKMSAYTFYNVSLCKSPNNKYWSHKKTSHVREKKLKKRTNIRGCDLFQTRSVHTMISDNDANIHMMCIWIYVIYTCPNQSWAGIGFLSYTRVWI